MFTVEARGRTPKGHYIGVLPYLHPLLDPESALGSMWVRVKKSEL